MAVAGNPLRTGGKSLSLHRRRKRRIWLRRRVQFRLQTDHRTARDVIDQKMTKVGSDNRSYCKSIPTAFKRAVLEAAISIEMPGAARGNMTAVPAPQTLANRIYSNELQKGRGQR
jgi:hypothetical protein